MTPAKELHMSLFASNMAMSIFVAGLGMGVRPLYVLKTENRPDR